MKTKPKNNEWKPDERGRYSRRIGFSLKADGTRDRHTFKLGTDLAKAKARAIRVQELWSHVVERANRPPELSLSSLGFEPEPKEPVWDLESLWIARQMAMGHVQIVVERGHEESGYPYTLRLQRLASTYPCVVFIPEDVDAHQQGAAFIRKAAEHQVRQIQKLCPNIAPTATGTLHDALDAYQTSIRKNDVEPTDEGPKITAFGALKVEQVARLKHRHKDRPLFALDWEGCQELIDYWRIRPLTDDKRIKKPRAMARKTCQNQISELKRFFKWLHRSKAYEWRKPADFDELSTRVKDIASERTSIAHMTQVRVYVPEELAILYKYATPLERLMLLLGLNCGFRGAEAGTLLLDHLFLDRPHPNDRYLKQIDKYKYQEEDRFILYCRNKTTVYGEFMLWPHTQVILRWAVNRQQAICQRLGSEKRNLLMTDKGSLFYRMTSGGKNRSQLFGNKWDALIKRVRKDHKQFPDYSFSSLRDTAANMIREVADGEAAAVFLMHGNPVKSDDLLDLYTNRPFHKVFDGLRRVQEKLHPMFTAAPIDICEQPQQQYTTMRTREWIVELKQQGKKVSQIMEVTGVSRMTVLRTLDRLYFKPKKKMDTKKTRV